VTVQVTNWETEDINKDEPTQKPTPQNNFPTDPVDSKAETGPNKLDPLEFSAKVKQRQVKREKWITFKDLKKKEEEEECGSEVKKETWSKELVRISSPSIGPARKVLRIFEEA
jgi:hypothetical protein